MADRIVEENEATPREQSFAAAPKSFNAVTLGAILVVILLVVLGALLLGGFFGTGVNGIDSPEKPASSQPGP